MAIDTPIQSGILYTIPGSRINEFIYNPSQKGPAEKFGSGYDVSENDLNTAQAIQNTQISQSFFDIIKYPGIVYRTDPPITN